MFHIDHDDLRARLSKFLPKAMERALGSYRMIALSHPVDGKSKEADPAGQKKQHEACRAAIVHVEQLVKLAKIYDLPNSKTGSKQEQEDLRKALDAVHEELRQHDTDRREEGPS